MNKDYKITAVIPVREGSQRVKNKNIRKFGQSCLLEEKIKILKTVNGIDRIIVSSDSDKMLDIARKYNVDVHKREQYYASSQCPNHEFWTYLAENVVKSGYIMLANCVAPLIRKETYETIIHNFKNLDNKYDCITTVDNVKDFIWDANKQIPINYDSNLAPNSQNLPDWIKLTFAITITSCENVIERHNIVGARPFFYRLTQIEAQDIDTPFDFIVSKLLIENNIDTEEKIMKYMNEN